MSGSPLCFYCLRSYSFGLKRVYFANLLSSDCTIIRSYYLHLCQEPFYSKKNDPLKNEIPLIGLAVAAVWVMGLIGFLGITFTMATLLVPVLLLVVGSAYGIHVMSHFYEDIDHQSGFLDYKSVSIIISKSLKTILVPVILAGLTTAGSSGPFVIWCTF